MTHSCTTFYNVSWSSWRFPTFILVHNLLSILKKYMYWFPVIHMCVQLYYCYTDYFSSLQCCPSSLSNHQCFQSTSTFTKIKLGCHNISVADKLLKRNHSTDKDLFSMKIILHVMISWVLCGRFFKVLITKFHNYKMNSDIQ